MDARSLHGGTRCSVCNYGDCDIRLIGCGCMLHTRCAPLSLILEHRDCQQNGNEVTVHCRFCNTTCKPGIYINPLNFDILEKAIALRNDSSQSEASTLTSTSSGLNTSNGQRESNNDNTNLKKRSLDSGSGDETPGQASYIVYSQGRKAVSNGLTDDELHRTGRWNEEEIEFVDQLVTNFDQGLLPISSGSRLCSFLGDILLCKASRLTKKMKNAKLSSRAFVLSPASRVLKSDDCRMLSALQEGFVSSLGSQSAKLEMRFNLSRQWRTYFSNLCMQVECSNLDVGDWISSLEELESRASQAESQMRHARRRRMGLGGGGGSMNSVPTKPLTSGFGSCATTAGASTTSIPQLPRQISSQSVAKPQNAPCLSGMVGPSENYFDDASEGSLDDLVSDGPNDLSDQILAPKATPSDPMNNFGDDFDNAMVFLLGQGGVNLDQPLVKPKKREWSTSGNPFLEAIAVYLEERNLPFEYVDCWVPSLAHNESDREVRLLPAGFVARDDQDDSMTTALRAFGEYSKSFSFKPGRGLPGRVYSSGQTSWQQSLSNVHPSVFARVGGAKVYGLKTAAAIPFSAPGVGRMIVVMYSTRDLPVDTYLTNQCSMELSKYCPQPKWKLVIEIGSAEESKDSSTAIEELDTASLDPIFSGTNNNNNNNNNKQTAGYGKASEGGESTDDRTLETRIISLLGDQLPFLSTKSSSTGESSSSMASEMEELLPDIMRMRLLLLRPAWKRNPAENDAIEIIKSSFINYTEESQRSSTEIAMLLAREWSCLNSCIPLSPMQEPAVSMQTVPPLPDNTAVFPSTNGPSTAIPDLYKSHVLERTSPSLVGEASTMRALLQPFNFSIQPTPLNPNKTMLVYDHSIHKNNAVTNNHHAMVNHV